MSNSNKQPPVGLSPAAERLWREIADEIQLDSGGTLMLNLLAQSFDRREQARAALAAGGAVVEDRFRQQKPSPWLAVERDTTLTIQRCYHALGLDLQPPGDD
jgi:hypothetical protein